MRENARYDRQHAWKCVDRSYRIPIFSRGMTFWLTSEKSAPNPATIRPALCPANEKTQRYKRTWLLRN